MSATLLQLFWDLASVDPSVRLTSSVSLFLILKDSNVEVKDYVENRLIRGLASSREGARQGFSTALSEFWKIQSISVES